MFSACVCVRIKTTHIFVTVDIIYNNIIYICYTYVVYNIIYMVTYFILLSNGGQKMGERTIKLGTKK